MFERYRGRGFARGDGCALPAHYMELQAICDALSFAAQQEMAEAIERGDGEARERAYGKWLAYRSMLRVIEAREDEWTGGERAMLRRIDWTRERFLFPGYEAFEVARSAPGVEVNVAGEMTPG